MKVSVEDSCIACGACESICEAVFTVSDKASAIGGGVLEAILRFTAIMGEDHGRD